MNKSIQIFLCSVLCFLLNHIVMGQVRYDKNDRLIEENVHGKVKYISRNVYTAEGNLEKVKKNALITTLELAFDSAKNIILDSYYTLQDSSICKITFRYDKWRHEIEMNQDFNHETYMNNKFVTKYDNSGREITETKYQSDASKVYTDTFIYDTKGFLVEVYVVDPHETYNWKHVYTDDDKGKIVEIKEYEYSEKNKQYEFTWKSNKTYGKTGKVIEEKMRMNDGRIYQISQYKYNSKDSLEEVVIYSIDSILSKKESISYDKKTKTKNTEIISYGMGGVVTEIQHLHHNWQGQLLKDSGSNSFKSYSYDKYGNKEEEIDYDRDNVIKAKSIYQYTYDKKGNWLSRTTFTNGEAKEFIERTIIYYE